MTIIDIGADWSTVVGASIRLAGGVPASFGGFDGAEDVAAVDPAVSISVGASDSAVAAVAAASAGLKASPPFAWFADITEAGLRSKTPGGAAGGALWSASPTGILLPAPFAGAVGAELVNRPGIGLIDDRVARAASSR
jgi:hypothetical protein